MTKVISTGGETIDFGNILIGDTFKSVSSGIIYIKVPPMGSDKINAIRLSDGAHGDLSSDTQCTLAREIEVKF